MSGRSFPRARRPGERLSARRFAGLMSGRRMQHPLLPQPPWRHGTGRPGGLRVPTEAAERLKRCPRGRRLTSLGRMRTNIVGVTARRLGRLKRRQSAREAGQRRGDGCDRPSGRRDWWRRSPASSRDRLCASCGSRTGNRVCVALGSRSFDSDLLHVLLSGLSRPAQAGPLGLRRRRTKHSLVRSR